MVGPYLSSFFIKVCLLKTRLFSLEDNLRNILD